MKSAAGWMLTLAAVVSAVGCGGASNEEQCEKLTRGLESYREKLGACAPTDINQQPISRPVEERCAEDLGDVCVGQGEHSLENYVSCLASVRSCTPETQAEFDSVVADCMGLFARSETDAECTEAVIGK